MHSLELLADVLVSPRTAFSLLRGSPRWVQALGIYFLFKVLTVFTVIPYTEEEMAPGLRSTLIRQGLPTATADAVVDSQFHGSLRVLSSLGEGVKGTVALLALAALLTGALAAKQKSAPMAPFVRQLAVVSHASIPLSVGNFLMVILAASGLPNYLNPAVWLQFVVPHLLILSLASFLDPFNLWMVWLLTVGITVVFDNRAYWTSFSVVMAASVIFALSLSLFTWWSA